MFSICSEEEKQLHSELEKDDRTQISIDNLSPTPKWRDSIKAKNIITHRDPEVMTLKRAKHKSWAYFRSYLLLISSGNTANLFLKELNFFYQI